MRARGKHRVYQMVKRRTVAGKRPFEFESAAGGHDSHAVIRDRAVDDNCVAVAGVLAGDMHVLRDKSDTRRGQKQFVGLAGFNNLGVAGHDRYAGMAGRRRDGRGYLLQGGDIKTIFYNGGHRDTQRAGALHGEVIDRPAQSECADIPAGKEQRIDDERIRRECKAPAMSG